MPGHSRITRRLGNLSSQLAAGTAASGAAASAAEESELPPVGSGPGGQGFGPRAKAQPPHFACDDLAGAMAFFEKEGYVSTHAAPPQLDFRGNS